MLQRNYYPKLMPNDYLDNTWKPKMMVELARKYQELEVDKLKELMWGIKRCLVGIWYHLQSLN